MSLRELSGCNSKDHPPLGRELPLPAATASANILARNRGPLVLSGGEPLWCESVRVSDPSRVRIPGRWLSKNAILPATEQKQCVLQEISPIGRLSDFLKS
jgi:hypothetical protein